MAEEKKKTGIVSTVRSYFKKKKKKELTPEDVKKNPHNIRGAIKTIRNRRQQIEDAVNGS